MCVVGTSGGVGVVGWLDGVGSMIGDADNLERATLLVRKFSDSAIGCIALDSNTGGDEVSDLEEFLVAVGVDSFSVIFSTVQG